MKCRSKLPSVLERGGLIKRQIQEIKWKLLFGKKVVIRHKSLTLHSYGKLTASQVSASAHFSTQPHCCSSSHLVFVLGVGHRNEFLVNLKDIAALGTCLAGSSNVWATRRGGEVEMPLAAHAATSRLQQRPQRHGVSLTFKQFSVLQKWNCCERVYQRINTELWGWLTLGVKSQGALVQQKMPWRLFHWSLVGACVWAIQTVAVSLLVCVRSLGFVCWNLSYVTF